MSPDVHEKSAEKRLRVLITTNIPSPYMVDYCTELGKYCDLTVAFERFRAKDREESWYRDLSQSSFAPVWMDGVPVGHESGFCLSVLKLLNQTKYDRIIIANPTTPTGIMECLYCRFHRVPYILQSEGSFQGSGKGFKEKFKKFLMEPASYYLTGMGGNDDYFLMYGAAPGDLRPYCFTSLHAGDIDNVLVSLEERQQIRKHLGIHESHILLSVGSIIPRKGFDVLLKACARLSESVGIYIVGGAPSEECKEIVAAHKMQHVHFVDFCDSDVLRQYYHAADFFVLATREDTWGLVINEAMAAGLPVITTTRCIAGTQLIQDGVNGYLVPVNDPEALREKIALLLSDAALCSKMGANNLVKIRPYSIENMAETVFHYISSSNL